METILPNQHSILEGWEKASNILNGDFIPDFFLFKLKGQSTHSVSFIRGRVGKPCYHHESKSWSSHILELNYCRYIIFFRDTVENANPSNQLSPEARTDGIMVVEPHANRKFLFWFTCSSSELQTTLGDLLLWVSSLLLPFFLLQYFGLSIKRVCPFCPLKGMQFHYRITVLYGS